MTRRSKQSKRRNISPRRPRIAGIKTGPKAERFPYAEKKNAVPSELSKSFFISQL